MQSQEYVLKLAGCDSEQTNKTTVHVYPAVVIITLIIINQWKNRTGYGIWLKVLKHMLFIQAPQL